jgi:hypothetical protein
VKGCKLDKVRVCSWLSVSICIDVCLDVCVCVCVLGAVDPSALTGLTDVQYRAYLNLSQAAKDGLRKRGLKDGIVGLAAHRLADCARGGI